MRRDDYLNPFDLKNQCKGAVNRLQENQKALQIVSRSIDRFAKDSEIESAAFEALKRQLEDYKILIEGMQAAGCAGSSDFHMLAGLAGDEVLDGENIYSHMENALNMKEGYLLSEALFRRKTAMAEEPLLSLYYNRKAGQYARLADNSQRLYEKWREKSERFDEIAAATDRLFTDSESIDAWIQKGLAEIAGTFQNGGYMTAGGSEWRRQIINAGIRITMCYRDKGGDQNGPYTLWQRGEETDREYMRELVRGYEEYADYTDEDIEMLLMKLNSEGCGYVAFANIIADEYRRKEEEFEKVFGFPLFLENVNGNTYVNYNRLIMDLYCASDNHNKAEIMGAEYDIYDAGEDRSETVGRGTTQEDRIYRFERYMESYGLEARIENIECAPNQVYKRCEEEMEQGKRIIISTCPVRLVDDEDEPAHMDGGHAMTVTGLMDDGRIEVSSWGERYYITPEDSDYTEPEKNRAGDAYIKIQSVKFNEPKER